jgi:hypothetical protein
MPAPTKKRSAQERAKKMRIPITAKKIFHLTIQLEIINGKNL